MLTDAVFEGGVLCLNLLIPCVNTLNWVTLLNSVDLCVIIQHVARH